MKLRAVLAALILASLTACAAQPAAPAKPKHTFAIGTNDFLLDGQRFQIRCGEIHAPRVPREYWRHRLQMAKAMGLNTVCAYLFWNLHEPRPGEFNWSDQADAAEFCRIAQEEGLWVIRTASSSTSASRAKSAASATPRARAKAAGASRITRFTSVMAW